MQETSLEAFAKIKPHMGERQVEVFNALAALCKNQSDATDMEIAQFLGKKDPNYVRPRRYELVYKYTDSQGKSLLVEESCHRSCHVTGRQAIAWKIKDL